MIELITTSAFVLSSIYGGPTATGTDMVSTTTAPGATSRIEERMTSKELESTVRIYFKNDPILIDIARCESRFRQLNENGKILRGNINRDDVGIMQINEHYHADKARELGLDLRTIEGNLAYAKYLYDKEGTQPWISSSKCWKSSDQVALK